MKEWMIAEQEEHPRVPLLGAECTEGRECDKPGGIAALGLRAGGSE